MRGLLALLSLIKTRRSRVISCYSLDIGCLIFWYMSCWNNDEMKETGDRTGDVVEMKDMHQDGVSGCLSFVCVN